MIRSNPCKICGSKYHTAAFCRKYVKSNSSEKSNSSKSVIKKNLNTKKPKPKKPKLSRSKIKKDLDKLVKDYVKERDNYTCQWCGKVVSGKSCHGSHVYSVGSCSVLQFEPLNIKVLCAYCHRRRWHSSPPDAMAWFKKKFPDRLAKLDEMRIANVKKTTYELQGLVEYYKQLKHK